MKLWCYAKANVMVEHRFTDDVAICEANTLEDAYIKFSKMYSEKLLRGNITEVKFNSDGIFIATDY